MVPEADPNRYRRNKVSRLIFPLSFELKSMIRPHAPKHTESVINLRKSLDKPRQKLSIYWYRIICTIPNLWRANQLPDFPCEEPAKCKIRAPKPGVGQSTALLTIKQIWKAQFTPRAETASYTFLSKLKTEMLRWVAWLTYAFSDENFERAGPTAARICLHPPQIPVGICS